MSKSQEQLEKDGQKILDEARMILPGIQALFGFQLISVFNNSFKTVLSDQEQALHLGALGLVVISIALIMAPAAYQRQTEYHGVTQKFVELGTMWLTGALIPLMIAIPAEVYLISRVITDQREIGFVLSLFLFMVLAWFWFIYPQMKRLHKTVKKVKAH
jgi:hypothetical protein